MEDPCPHHATQRLRELWFEGPPPVPPYSLGDKLIPIQPQERQDNNTVFISDVRGGEESSGEALDTSSTSSFSQWYPTTAMGYNAWRAAVAECVADGADVCVNVHPGTSRQGRVQEDVPLLLAVIAAPPHDVALLRTLLQTPCGIAFSTVSATPPYALQDVVAFAWRRRRDRLRRETEQGVDEEEEEVARTLSFTAGGHHYEDAVSLLQLLCEFVREERVAVRMLQAVLDRLQRTCFSSSPHPHQLRERGRGPQPPEDEIQFGNERGDDDELFLNNAAFHHRLAVFWGAVKHVVPHYCRVVRVVSTATEDVMTKTPQGTDTDEEEQERLFLTTPVFRFDWDRVSEADKKCFVLTEGILPRNVALNMLCRERPVSLEAIRLCCCQADNVEIVDLCYLDEDIHTSSLHWVVESGSAACLKVCLNYHGGKVSPPPPPPQRSPTPAKGEGEDVVVNELDLSLKDTRGQTPLHLLCDVVSPRAAAEMLRLLVFYFETHPRTRIAFEQKNRYGMDFVNYAACRKRLSLFFPLVSHLPYFADAAEPIVLDAPLVKEVDISQLSDQDRACFHYVATAP